MDCMHAAEVLSAMLDREDVSPMSVAQVREHCARCAECAALRATMDRIATVPAPHAPARLVTSIIDGVRAEAAAAAETVATNEAVAPDVVEPLESERPRLRFVPTWWQPRFTPIASAAAVALVVGAVSTYALVQMIGPPGQTMTVGSFDATNVGDAGAESAQDPWTAAPMTESATDDSRSMAEGSAPQYVTWGGGVWVRADGVMPQESALSQVGVTVSDLGGAGGPSDQEVMETPTDRGAIFVRTQDGGLIRFMPVSRTLERRTYTLVTGTPLSAFGTWPTLPQRFSVPTTDDGSPNFAVHGSDDLGREVFVPAGADVADGFALAPGTPPDDPAAGNPNWTWWEPVR